MTFVPKDLRTSVGITKELLMISRDFLNHSGFPGNLQYSREIISFGL